MRALDGLCIQAMGKVNLYRDKLYDFWKKQDGVSNVVATIIILAIVIGMIAIFNERLQSWIMEIIDDMIGTDPVNSSGWTNGN